MKIEKFYEENINLGNYQTAKIGIKIISSKDIGMDDLEKTSAYLTQVMQQMVRKELEQIKKERVENNGQ